MALTVRGRELSFAWLKPPPSPPDGNMSLYDHLRELRYRVLFAMIAVGVGMAVSAIFYNQLYGVLMWPLNTARAELAISHPDLQLQATNNDITSPFIIAMKVVAICGLVFTAPVWLYQLWAFIMPGLLANEKKWARIFVGCATPLFLAGVVTGYLLMPKAVSVLIGFTPEDQGILNLLTVETFLSFLIRVMLVFGASYLIPLLMLMLNFVGVISAKQMKKFRPFIIFGAFLFAAVATPSTDPFSMIALALPLTILMMITEQIAKWNEKRLGRNSDDPLARDKVLQDMLAADEAAKLEAEKAEAATETQALDSADKK
ncbi:twin-arginine translocase subunit TatC [Propionibacteriaceae bacterium Y2011]